MFKLYNDDPGVPRFRNNNRHCATSSGSIPGGVIVQCLTWSYLQNHKLLFIYNVYIHVLFSYIHCTLLFMLYECVQVYVYIIVMTEVDLCCDLVELLCLQWHRGYWWQRYDLVDILLPIIK